MGDGEVEEEDFGKAPVLFFVESVDERVFYFLNPGKALGQFQQDDKPEPFSITYKINHKHNKVSQVHYHAIIEIIFGNCANFQQFSTIDQFNQ